MSKLEEFSPERFEEEPFAAHQFLALIEMTSQGLLPEDWTEWPTTELVSAATKILLDFTNDLLISSQLKRMDGLH